MFHVKALNNLLTTCILKQVLVSAWFNFIRDSSFMQNVLYIACVQRIVI